MSDVLMVDVMKVMEAASGNLPAPIGFCRAIFEGVWLTGRDLILVFGAKKKIIFMSGGGAVGGVRGRCSF